MASSQQMPAFPVPEVKLSSSSGHRKIPVIGLGMAVDNKDENVMKFAVLEAIKLGYRHFDTASMYGTEKALGEAIIEAVRLGIVSSREELFITSKLWSNDAHRDLVVPALKKSLRTLQMEYIDLYLIHMPISAKPSEKYVHPISKEDILPMDFRGVWEGMEECQRLGLTKSIGVSNFSSKKIDTILAFATIPPSVNQVEMNPAWQQRKLIEFCKSKSIIVTAYSPLGAVGSSWGNNQVMSNEALKQIAKSHGKTVAQVCLRWIIEQGATVVVKSFNKERLKENLGIFDWELRDNDYEKINKIPQQRMMVQAQLITPDGPFKTPEKLWDD
ncbi:NADPH-dependent codeinone reductase-like protein [Melia azedarach]|uniref:NADPH-dependent codeinone reductase-like protein n=1 Tax=Melia azedarach TaxID=155640 RepID=A0ACC1XI41_MELAZ|nr:NADPH-dependent codeinone reductase-like protein [Melia azedarach]